MPPPPRAYADHTRDPGAWARDLGVSREAIDLYLASDVIDLHIDTFIWTRVFGYDLAHRHGAGLLAASVYGQADLPRLREARVTGGTWVITTNPFRSAPSRARTFEKNLGRLRAIFERSADDVVLARNASDYARARAQNKHAAFIGIQGGNALDRDPDALDLAGDDILRVTLVHLYASSIGGTSAPSMAKDGAGLSAFGKEFVRRLNAKRIFVDLAHIHRSAFFDAVEVHDKSQPLIVTHTGVSGAFAHWRNLDDEQLRAIADTGGTVGIMYHAPYLGDPLFEGRASTVVDHIAHAVKVAGEDSVSLGSDWDGAIVTPRDMPTCLELPRLVDIMLRRGFSAETITKILGKNFLRVLAHLRGPAA